MFEMNEAYKEKQIMEFIEEWFVSPKTSSEFEISLNTNLWIPELRIRISTIKTGEINCTPVFDLKIELKPSQVEMFRSFVLELLDFSPLEHENSFVIKRKFDGMVEFDTRNCRGKIIKSHSDNSVSIEVFSDLRVDNRFKEYLEGYIRRETDDSIESVIEDNEEATVIQYTFFKDRPYSLYVTYCY